jgi:hypothetical protein
MKSLLASAESLIEGYSVPPLCLEPVCWRLSFPLERGKGGEAGRFLGGDDKLRRSSISSGLSKPGRMVMFERG